MRALTLQMSIKLVYEVQYIGGFQVYLYWPCLKADTVYESANNLSA